MKIRCPFCTFSVKLRKKEHNDVVRVADMLRFHLQYDCPIHNVKYAEDYL